MINEEMLNKLRERVSSMMSEYRYNHTLGVEKMALYLARHCLPEKTMEVSAAALLHDITKELPYQTQLELIKKCKPDLDEDTISTSSVLHSLTAPYIVKRDFPDFATDEILSAIEKHTLGDEEMSVLDKIVFLADFIEDSRSYPDSLTTAKFVKSSMRKGYISNNISVLNRACIMEFDSTLSHLARLGREVNKKTLLARDSLLSKM